MAISISTTVKKLPDSDSLW